MTPVFLMEPEAAAELEAAALWYEARRVGLGVEVATLFGGCRVTFRRGDIRSRGFRTTLPIWIGKARSEFWRLRMIGANPATGSPGSESRQANDWHQPQRRSF